MARDRWLLQLPQLYRSAQRVALLSLRLPRLEYFPGNVRSGEWLFNSTAPSAASRDLGIVVSNYSDLSKFIAIL